MNRLRELRLENGYKSQQDLAKVLFVNQTAVSQWERGITIPTAQTLIKLSKMYGVSIDYILGTSNERLLPDDEPKEKPLTNTDEGQMEALDAEIIGRLVSLTPEEMGKVDAFVQGMIASRSKDASPPM